MNVFQIDQPTLDTDYRGSGYALACIRDGQVVQLAYLRELLPDWDDPSEGDAEDIQDQLAQVIPYRRLKPTIEKFALNGQVAIGLCSATEFIEL